ncbi:MAG: hypothetical protein LAO56_23400 [Acidobacteriia bacterium]|nr:hypothetical protein [Terriglobia bacterium]
MNLADVTKRLQTLQQHLTSLKLDKPITREDQVNSGIDVWAEQLQALAQVAHRIRQRAEAIGDDRTALAAVGELRRIVELSAKMTGQLEDKAQINVVHVDLNPETAERIAETYLARHRTLESPQ